MDVKKKQKNTAVHHFICIFHYSLYIVYSICKISWKNSDIKERGYKIAESKCFLPIFLSYPTQQYREKTHCHTPRNKLHGYNVFDPYGSQSFYNLFKPCTAQKFTNFVDNKYII